MAGDVDAVRIDVVGRLEAVDQLADEDDVVRTRMLAPGRSAAEGVPAVGDSVRVDGDAAEPVRLDIDAGGRLGREAAAGGAVKDDHQARGVREDCRSMDTVGAIDRVGSDRLDSR